MAACGKFGFPCYKCLGSPVFSQDVFNRGAAEGREVISGRVVGGMG